MALSIGLWTYHTFNEREIIVVRDSYSIVRAVLLEMLSTDEAKTKITSTPPLRYSPILR